MIDARLTYKDYNNRYLIEISALKYNMLDFFLATEKEIGQELCSRLRSQRLSQSMTQQDLAQHAGLSLNTVKNFERKGQASLESLLRIVIALGLVDDLKDAFALKVQSIAQMERAEKAKRLRAPRKRRP